MKSSLHCYNNLSEDDTVHHKQACGVSGIHAHAQKELLNIIDDYQQIFVTVYSRKPDLHVFIYTYEDLACETSDSSFVFTL